MISFIEIPHDMIRNIVNNCDRISKYNLYCTHPLFQKFTIFDSQCITFRSAIKLCSKFYVSMLKSMGHKLDIDKYFLEIVKTNCLDFISDLIDVNFHHTTIDKHYVDIIKHCTDEIILYLLRDNVDYEDLVVYEKRNIIMFLHSNSKDPVAFGKMIVEITMDNNYICINIIDYLVDNGFVISNDNIAEIIRRKSTNDLEWLENFVGTNRIKEVLSTMNPDIIIPRNIKWLKDRLYQLDLDFSQVNTVAYYAECNDFSKILKPDMNNEHLSKIIYYAIKYNRNDILSDKQISKYNLDDLKMVAKKSAGEIWYYLDTDEKNRNRLVLKQHILDRSDDDTIRKLAAISEFRISTLLNIYRDGRKDLFFSLTFGVIEMLKFNDVIYSVETCDIELCKILNNNLIMENKSLFLKYLMEHSSFECIKGVIENSNHNIWYLVNLSVLYRDKHTTQYLLDKGYRFDKHSLYYAFNNCVSAAEWVYKRHHYNLDTTFPTMTRLNNDEVDNDNNELYTRFWEWFVSKKPNPGKYTIDDAIKDNNMVYHKYLVDLTNINK